LPYLNQLSVLLISFVIIGLISKTFEWLNKQ